MKRNTAQFATQLSDIPFPSTEHLERQFLTDAVYNPESIGDVMPLIRPDMFSQEGRRKIWENLVSMFNGGERIDLVSAFAKCGSDLTTEVINLGLTPGGPTSFIERARLFKAADTKKRAYLSALRLLQESADTGTTEDTILASSERMLQEIQGNVQTESEVRLSDVLEDIAGEIEEKQREQQNGGTTRVPTGFPVLDWYTYQGFGPGQLVILAARPSVGKTALMLKFAKSAALAGIPSCIFSVEMTNNELGQRALYSTGMVSPQEVISGNVEWGKFNEATGQISGLPIYINDHSRDVNEIISRITINVRRGRCKVAFIDYLGLLDSGKDGKTPLYQSLGYITGALKVAAKRAKIPIVLLCQLNRDMAKENRPPQLYDLRDSGSIEQDADIVLMLSQKVDPMAPEGTVPDIEMWLRKNRQFKKDVCITIRPNTTYSDFFEVGTRT